MDQLYYYEKLFIIHLGGIKISFLDSTQMMKSTVLKRPVLTRTEYIKCDRWSEYTVYKRREMFKSGKVIKIGHTDQQDGNYEHGGLSL